MVKPSKFISKEKLNGAKKLFYALDKKVLNRKLYFWLPFRSAFSKDSDKGRAYLKELKIDYAQALTKEQLEKELVARFNKIELKKIEENLKTLENDLGNDTIEESKADNFGKSKKKYPDLTTDPV